MKHYINFYLFVIALCFISCDDNSTDPSDKAISTMILGKWVANNSEVIYYPDGTSKSTSIEYYNQNNLQKDSLVITSYAKYKIENNILISSDINIQLSASSDSIDVALGKMIPVSIEIINDTLIFTPVYVYSKTEGNPNVLDGRWFTKIDCFLRNSDLTITMGTEEFDYYFQSENNYYHESKTLRLNGYHNQVDNGTYIIENGCLKLNRGDWQRIKIESNILYLFQKYSFKLSRIN